MSSQRGGPAGVGAGWTLAGLPLARLMGVGRASLLVGVGVVTVATMAGLSRLAWAGVAFAGVALAVNSAGKLARYGRMEAPLRHRALVGGAWLLLAVTVLALILDYTRSQVMPGYVGDFWSLAIGGAGLAMVYQGLRSKLVPDTPATDDGG